MAASKHCPGTPHEIIRKSARENRLLAAGERLLAGNTRLLADSAWSEFDKSVRNWIESRTQAWTAPAAPR